MVRISLDTGETGAFPASGIPKSDPAGTVQNIQCKGHLWMVEALEIEKNT